MHKTPLHIRDGHLFLELNGALWLFDTGSPGSFGAAGSLALAGEVFSLPADLAGLTAGALSDYIGVECSGLLGGDVLGRFDFVLDAPNHLASISTQTLELSGIAVKTDWMMGIPIISARIRDRDFSMVLDTGAQLSYFQDSSLDSFPAAGRFTDFHPSTDVFETETHLVDVSLGGVAFTIRAGRLDGPLAATLTIIGGEGIVGNAILQNRIVGYFPRRCTVVL